MLLIRKPHRRELRLGIRYAESVEDAEQNRLEDGNLFFADELDEGPMFIAMIQEITSQ